MAPPNANASEESRPWHDDLGRYLERHEMIDRPCPYACGGQIYVPRLSAAPPPPEVLARAPGGIRLLCSTCRGPLDPETGEPWSRRGGADGGARLVLVGFERDQVHRFEAHCSGCKQPTWLGARQLRVLAGGPAATVVRCAACTVKAATQSGRGWLGHLGDPDLRADGSWPEGELRRWPGESRDARAARVRDHVMDLLVTQAASGLQLRVRGAFELHRLHGPAPCVVQGGTVHLHDPRVVVQSAVTGEVLYQPRQIPLDEHTEDMRRWLRDHPQWPSSLLERKADP